MQNLNKVHLNGLRAIEAVGRLGSLQAAAAEFNVSVGAISQHVARAESQLGHRLFDRNPRGMQVNDFGRPILERLGAAFRAMSDAVNLAERQDNTILTISVAPVFASRWLVRRLYGFTEAHPDIRLRIDASTRLVDPGHHDVDLAIRVGDGSWRDVRVEKILDQQVFPVMAPSLAARLKAPSELLSLPVVIDGRAMFSWDVWLAAAGFKDHALDIRHVFNEASLCLDAVIAGQGMMLAWQTLAADAMAEGRLVAPSPIRARTGFGHYFVTAREGREPSRVKAFKTWLRRALGESMAGLEGAPPSPQAPEL
jgi:DNA-binding transcriptional LysR family regulator